MSREDNIPCTAHTSRHAPAPATSMYQTCTKLVQRAQNIASTQGAGVAQHTRSEHIHHQIWVCMYSGITTAVYHSSTPATAGVSIPHVLPANVGSSHSTSTCTTRCGSMCGCQQLRWPQACQQLHHNVQAAAPCNNTGLGSARGCHKLHLTAAAHQQRHHNVQAAASCCTKCLGSACVLPPAALAYISTPAAASRHTRRLSMMPLHLAGSCNSAQHPTAAHQQLQAVTLSM